MYYSDQAISALLPPPPNNKQTGIIKKKTYSENTTEQDMSKTNCSTFNVVN